MQHADQWRFDVETALTYSQLWERVSNFAAYLQQHGVMKFSRCRIAFGGLLLPPRHSNGGWFLRAVDPKYPASAVKIFLPVPSLRSLQ